MRGADLQEANLREAHLQGTNLRNADLDGADLSRAHLGENEANRVNLHHAKLSYATLKGLDLRGFDLTGLDLRNADLNETDLRDALLRETDLRGADLSTAQLHGSELRGAKLYSDELFGDWSKHAPRGTPSRKKLTSGRSMLTRERSSPMQRHEVKQARRTLSDREAYILGEHALLDGSASVKIRRLFPEGFNFATAHQLFDAWLAQSVDSYNEQEIQAMWIRFAHRLCDVYHEDEPEG